MIRSTISRRRLLAAGSVTAAALAAPQVVRASPTLAWRMVTSWPKNLPGPGVTAERLARRINTLSGGRIAISVHAAGELMPALQVFDAVAEGTAEMAHTASFFWQGKMVAAPFFTAFPFGLTAGEHAAWIYHGGGQSLWDDLYGTAGVKPFMAGNTGMSMGGWYKREIASLDDFAGRKLRMPGLGGEIARRLGATPISVPPGDILPALQAGTIDGTEFLGPWSDLASGFFKAAKFYYWPGFHEPNGTGEALISLKAWRSLPQDLQTVVENACAAEAAFALAESEWHNARALAALVQDHGVELRAFPDDLLRTARAAALDLLADMSTAEDITGKIARAYRAELDLARRWAGVSTGALLQAR